MSAKITKGQIYYIKKINITRSTICVENFMLVSKSAQGWYYAALLNGLLTVSYLVAGT